MGSPFVALWRTRSIQWLLIRRELKVRYGSSSLGYFWTVLDPLLSCLVFWLVFGVIFGSSRGVGVPKPFIVFLVCGYLPWQTINGTVSDSVRALSSESKLIRSTSLPRELWVLRLIGAKSIELVLSIPVLLAFMLVFHKGFTRGVVYVPLAFLLMTLALTGMAMALSAMCVIYRDLNRIVRICMRLLFYMTPVLYPSTRVITELDKHAGLDWVGRLYFLNPFVAVIDLFRTALWRSQFPGWHHIAVSAFVSTVLLVGGIAVFRRLEGAVLKEI